MGGQNPLENDAVLRRMIFVKESQIYPDIKVKRALEAASWFYPNWDAELAGQLMEDFDLPANRPIKKLSRGMHSAVGIVIGLAARAEITLFDEPYLGLDAVARQIFYDRLLADYAEHPRTVLLSTHLIDEVANLLEHVMVIDQGRIVVDAPADELRGRAVTVSGRASAVDEFIAHREVLNRQGDRVAGHGDRRPGRWTIWPAPGRGIWTWSRARCRCRNSSSAPQVTSGKGSAHDSADMPSERAPEHARSGRLHWWTGSPTPGWSGACWPSPSWSTARSSR